MPNASRAARILDGKYQLIESLGKGGMSEVWLARDKRLGKLWAIKEIKPNTQGTAGEVIRRAIIAEADFMKRLDHPAIPRVVDILQTGAEVFVVMDYVDGQELGRTMRLRNEPFAQDDVIDWGIQLCDVLGYLHRRNPPVIYRDMKPSNVMLSDGGLVRLIDFGICMQCEPGVANDGLVVGTPGYAPPEQIPTCAPGVPAKHMDSNATVDARSDVYALGATLYSLVTGHVPHHVQDERGQQRVEFSMRPIRSWDATLSEGLERILLKATRPDPSERYQSMAQMRYDLEHYEELTQEWRDAQRAKLASFSRLAVTTLVLALCGVALVFASALLRRNTFEEYLRVAEDASATSEEGLPSDAEIACSNAMEVAPDRIEPFERLLRIYEQDFQLTDDEERRLRQAFAQAQNLDHSSRYAQLCFDMGVAYLSYYRLDHAGGSVGNAALASMDAAAPWFERVVASCSGNTDDAKQEIDAADVRAAHVYGVIASFHQTVTRAGQEGRSAQAAYAAFWDALSEVLQQETESPAAQRSAEGVRVRLCQCGVQAMASPTYLAGLARAGVSQEQVRDALARVKRCLADLGDFAQAQEFARVYGPVFDEMRSGMATVEQNIQNVYANPVETLGAGQEGEDL